MLLLSSPTEVIWDPKNAIGTIETRGLSTANRFSVSAEEDEQQYHASSKARVVLHNSLDDLCRTTPWMICVVQLLG